MNVSATLNFFKLIQNPSLCLPQATIPTFNQLPIPISKAFVPLKGEKLDIRAIVLDKDNCFAKPKENVVYKPYEEKFKDLKAAYPHSQLLIVSNSAGSNDDSKGKEAVLLEEATGIKVLRHSIKKPGCGSEILDYFRNLPDTRNISPRQIVVVGDRLLTDVMMANMMGSWSIWVKNGVVQKNFISQWESRLSGFLFRRGFVAPKP